MRLKSIKLAGFKSFVDPTTVNFPSNLCAVVGPNGCGKSNIIDAVRWVMGESSAKHLRGESMADVIFNGSNSRKPVGQASIELIFDNSDGSLGGEYAAFSEISIKRKVTRDGQSFYFLNGNKCRRRDITDIFLGTGLGPRSYAIIEQGMISNLIEAKPDELRVYIEEAAGISKYKERRRDTENRMRRTQENLERLTDIRDELDRQLQRLERQAKAAEKYTELKAEEREVKAQLQALRYRDLDSELEQKRTTIRELEVKVEGVIAEQRGCDTRIEKARERHTELSERFNEVQGRFYSAGADIARIEQSIQHSQERTRQLQEDLEQTERNCREAEEHLQQDTRKVTGWEAELTEIAPDLELAQAAAETSADTLADAEEAMQQWQGDWERFNQAAAEPKQQAEVQQSRIQHLEQAIKRLHERIERLTDEKQQLSAGPVEEEIAQLSEQQAELDLASEEAQAKIDQLGEQLDASREANQQASTELDQQREQLQQLRGRQASLEALQQAALGETGEAVQAWLEQQGLAQQPRLAEQLDVDSGWETAVETALGPHLQAVCVDDLDAVSAALGELTQGSVQLLDRRSVNASGGERGALLADKVRGELSVAGLLAGIYAVDDLAAALALRPQLAANESVMTRDGIWLGPNWLRLRRDDDAQAGVLARRQELEQLAARIAELSDAVTQGQEALDAGRQQRRDLEQQREVVRKEAAELGRRYSEVRSQLSAKQVRVEQISVRRERADQEIGEARAQIEQEQQQLAEARALLEAAIESMTNDTERREELLSVRDERRAVLDQARQRARHDKDKAHELAMRHQSVKTQLSSIAQSIERLRTQTQQLQERRELLRDQLSQNDSPVADLKLELEEKLALRLEVENELADARREVEAVEHELRETEKQRQHFEHQRNELRGELEHLRIDAQTLEVHRRAILEQLAESPFELKTLLEELPEAADPRQWEEELERLAGKIQRLGAINLAAIEEFKIESERKHYLDAQDAELQEALGTLEDAIRKIDRETRTRFKETFDQVNKGLQELFPKVFGGGHAYLELTGEDLLDTGIAIMARPPGKKNSTIHLLSGGEKALTAIALVFAIFRLNPAPFCMLDEVDAPLDDANVGRYCRMVQEMSESVQFVYITHNKIAMEMAHQLMGVTMQEPGVSRMVSVDVDEAAELAAV